MIRSFDAACFRLKLAPNAEVRRLCGRSMNPGGLPIFIGLWLACLRVYAALNAAADYLDSSFQDPAQVTKALGFQWSSLSRSEPPRIFIIGVSDGNWAKTYNISHKKGIAGRGKIVASSRRNHFRP